MKSSNLFFKIGVSTLFVFLLFFSGHHDVNAATACSSKKIIGSTAPYFGPNPSQALNLVKGDQVIISIVGEDGCAGQTATFDLEEHPNQGTATKEVEPLSLVLDKGTPISGQSGALLFKANWKIDVGSGTYIVALVKVGNSYITTTKVSNTLNVQDSKQSCTISKIYSSNTHLAPGSQVQLIIETQGSCQATPPWKASLNVIDDTDQHHPTVFAGSAQDVTSSNKVVWNWTLPILKSGQTGNAYHLSGNLGNQVDVESSQFCSGDCNVSNNGYEINNGSTGATAPTNYDFEIKNPLAGGPNTLFDVIDIVTKWLITFSIPLAVLFILWAGFLFLTAGPRPGNVKKAREVLQWTVVGLAIIFIGRGFITLIFSVLNLQNSSAPTIQQNTTSSAPTCDQGVCSNGAGPCVNSTQCVSNTTQNNSDGTLNSVPTYYNGNDNSLNNSLPSGASDGSLEYQNILNISPDGSTNIPVNQYSEIGITVHNPAGPSETFNWTKTSGSLPPGMSVVGQSDAGGQRIAGTPTQKGNYTFTLQAMDIPAREYGTVKVTINVQ